MAYGQGRLCVQISPKHFRIGDIHLAFDPINVLKFRETKILNEGGGFTVSGKLGEIVSLQFANVADTSTGDGPLLAICQNGFSTFAINNPRATWSNIPTTKSLQLIGSSITGNEAYTNIGEDILYRVTRKVYGPMLSVERNQKADLDIQNYQEKLVNT